MKKIINTVVFSRCMKGKQTKKNKRILDPFSKMTGGIKLMKAICSGEVAEAVKLVADPKTNVNYFHPQKQRTPLHQACMYCYVDIVEALLKRPDINLDLENQFGETAFFIACEEGDWRSVRLFLQKENLAFNRASRFGITPIIKACMKQCVEVLQILIANERTFADLSIFERNDVMRSVFRQEKVELLEILMASRNEFKIPFSMVKMNPWPHGPELMDHTASYIMNEDQLRIDLRRKWKKDADILALTLFISDGYLKIKEVQSDDASSLKKATRFFKFLVKLPLEIQMLICKKIYQSNGEFYSSTEVQTHLRRIIRLYF